jgi:nitrile hydratase accessory protein
MSTSTPPEDEASEVFAAPWEARAFALVHELHARGLFTWRAFQEALAAEIARGDAAPEPTSGSTSVYYKQWYAAAVRLLAERALIDPPEIEARRAAILADLAHDHGHGG